MTYIHQLPGWPKVRWDAKIAKCSSDTALRDIRELIDRGILLQNERGGRSTSYRLAEPEAIPT